MKKPTTPTSPSSSQARLRRRLQLQPVTLRKLTSEELHRIAAGFMSTSAVVDETCHQVPR